MSRYLPDALCECDAYPVPHDGAHAFLPEGAKR
jgi:hypothetical protein